MPYVCICLIANLTLCQITYKGHCQTKHVLLYLRAKQIIAFLFLCVRFKKILCVCLFCSPCTQSLYLELTRYFISIGFHSSCFSYNLVPALWSHIKNSFKYRYLILVILYHSNCFFHAIFDYYKWYGICVHNSKHIIAFCCNMQILFLHFQKVYMFCLCYMHTWMFTVRSPEAR